MGWVIANKVHVDPKVPANNRLEATWTLPAKAIRFIGTGVTDANVNVTVDGRFVSRIDGSDLGKARFAPTEKGASGGALSPKILFPDASPLVLDGENLIGLDPYAASPSPSVPPPSYAPEPQPAATPGSAASNRSPS